MSALNVRMVPISLLGEVLLGKMVQPSRKNETDELRPYLRAAHLPAPGTLSLDVSEQQMYFSPHEIDRLDLRKSDVVIVEGGAGYGRSAYLDNDLGGWGFQNSIVRVRAYPGVSVGKYVYYALQHAQLDRQIELEVSTATLPHFTAEKVGRFRIPLPPLTTQRAIADYLDRETSEIDAMTADLDKVEALLTERRVAYIGRAVRTISGPSKRVRLQSIARIHAGETITAADIEDDGLFAVYGGNGVRGYADRANEEHDRVLVGRQGALCGNVHLARGPFFASEHALVGEPHIDVDLEWLALVLSDQNLGQLSMSAAQPGITAMGVGLQKIDMPGMDEQRRIAAQMDRETAEIDAMLADITELRDLLAERRAALIAAAVTGQINIQTAEEPTHA